MRELSIKEVNHVSGASGELLFAGLFLGTAFTIGAYNAANSPYYSPYYGYSYDYVVYDTYPYSPVIVYDFYDYYPSYPSVVWVI